MLVGSNGSGKSTLFQLIAGLQQPQGGKISRRRHAALVFQNPDHQLLLPSCSSDLLLGMRNGGSAADQRRRAASLLRLLGLSELETRPIHTLSGGQKQRLAIAGALASDAGLLLLDEPTALLDPDSQRTVLTTVEGLCRSSPEPLTALWITHRLEELDHCTAAARMDAGRIGPWTSGKELRRRLQDRRSDR
jgi:energy-coupling factor transport system ATP-binding protein